MPHGDFSFKKKTFYNIPLSLMLTKPTIIMDDMINFFYV